MSIIAAAGPQFTTGQTGSERGATIVEFVSVGVVFFLLVLGLIDIARYTYARIVLAHAAQAALNAGQKSPELALDLLSVARTDPRYLDFVRARARVAGIALQLPTQTIFARTRTAMYSLHQFVNFDNVNDGTVQHPADALVLRPGDFARDTTARTIVYHPTLCPPWSGCGPGDRGYEAWADIIRTHPLVLELRGEMRPLALLFTRRITFTVRATGYFEVASSTGAP